MPHSPGPWKWYRGDVLGQPVLIDAANVAITWLEPGTLPDEEDVRLIAAAPRLLAALRAFVCKWNDDKCNYCGDQEWRDGEHEVGHAKTCPMVAAIALIAEIEGK